ncbi:MAG: CPBP family intramembrane metalloprotease [Clostridia bacterium]|nr:CPBP family intramembrane metalloprotease [Clostridia bacterium]
MDEMKNETEVMAEQTEQIQPPKKKHGALAAIGFGLLMVVIFYAIQTIGASFVSVGYVVRYILENGPQAATSQKELMEAMMNSGVMTVATTVATVLTTTVFGLWYFFQYGRKRKFRSDDSLKKIFTWKKTVLYIIAAFCCYLLAVDIISIIELFTPETVDSYIKMMDELKGGSEGLMALTVVILAPFGEECIFRGILLKNFEKRIPILGAIILQAVFFGIFHMNIVQGIFVVVLGCVCGYVAYKEQSVLPAILIHLVYNSSSYLINALPEAIVENDMIWIFAPILPLAIGIALYRAFGFHFSLKRSE